VQATRRLWRTIARCYRLGDWQGVQKKCKGGRLRTWRGAKAGNTLVAVAHGAARSSIPRMHADKSNYECAGLQIHAP
jgi:hypothetical protein